MRWGAAAVAVNPSHTPSQNQDVIMPTARKTTTAKSSPNAAAKPEFLAVEDQLKVQVHRRDTGKDVEISLPLDPHGSIAAAMLELAEQGEDGNPAKLLPLLYQTIPDDVREAIEAAGSLKVIRVVKAWAEGFGDFLGASLGESQGSEA